MEIEKLINITGLSTEEIGKLCVEFSDSRNVDLEVPLSVIMNVSPDDGLKLVDASIGISKISVNERGKSVGTYLKYLNGITIEIDPRIRNSKRLLTSAIRDGLVMYPYNDQYGPPVDSLIDNRHNVTVEVIDNPPQTSDGYLGKHLVLVHNDDDYHNIDIITDYFTSYARVKCHVRNKQPPIIAWRDMANRVADKAVDYAIDRSIYVGPEALEVGIYLSGIKMCTKFKVSLAMAIYDFFKASVVYDSSSGWGDRAIAAALSDTVIKYVGTDPNIDLVSGYQHIVDYFGEKRPEKSIDFYDYPAEDLNLDAVFEDGLPDLVFSSPPFFDYEIYSDLETQSVARHDTASDWLNGWLIPVTMQSWNILPVGGRLVYYLGNCGTKSVQKLISEMSNVIDALYEGKIQIATGRGLGLYIYVWQKIA